MGVKLTKSGFLQDLGSEYNKTMMLLDEIQIKFSKKSELLNHREDSFGKMEDFLRKKDKGPGFYAMHSGHKRLGAFRDEEFKENIRELEKIKENLISQLEGKKSREAIFQNRAKIHQSGLELNHMQLAPLAKEIGSKFKREILIMINDAYKKIDGNDPAFAKSIYENIRKVYQKLDGDQKEELHEKLMKLRIEIQLKMQEEFKMGQKTVIQ